MEHAVVSLYSLRLPEPGKACVSGKVSVDANDTDGPTEEVFLRHLSSLILQLHQRNRLRSYPAAVLIAKPTISPAAKQIYP